MFVSLDYANGAEIVFLACQLRFFAPLWLPFFSAAFDAAKF
jgi:hypothetical protein